MTCLRKSALYRALATSFGEITVTASWLLGSDRLSCHGMLICGGFRPINGGAVVVSGCGTCTWVGKVRVFVGGLDELLEELLERGQLFSLMGNRVKRVGFRGSCSLDGL